MNSSNELYNLVDSQYSFQNKNSINTNHGAVIYDESTMYMYHNTIYTFISRNFNIIDSISTETHTIVLCNTTLPQPNYNDFLYIQNHSNNSHYTLLLNNNISLFSINHTMYYKDILYLIDDNNNFIAIDILDTSAQHDATIDVTKYPGGNLYNAYIISSLKAPAKSYSKRAIYSEGIINIPVENECSIAQFNIKNNSFEVKELSKDFYEIIGNINSIEPCLISSEDNESCIVACISANKNIYMVDMIDLSSYCIRTCEANTTVINNGGSIYAISSSLYKINTKDFEISSVDLQDNISQYQFVSINGELIGHSTVNTKKLEKCSSFSVINIVCMDDGGNIISRSQTRLQTSKTLSIKAPVIDGFTVVGDAIKNVTATTDIMFVYFSYSVSKPKSLLNIFHMYNNEILQEQSIEGIIGEKYSIKPISIPGFYYYDGYNATGVFKQSNDNCLIYYTSEIFHTDNDNNSYICAICKCNDEVLVRKYIQVNKGTNIVIKSPILNGYSAATNTTTVPLIENDIYDIEIQYAKTKEAIPVIFKINGNTVFENTCFVNNDIVTIEYPDFLENKYEFARINGNKFIIINAYPSKPISLVNIVNSKTNEILYSITRTGMLDNIAYLDIDNMEYIETTKQSLNNFLCHTMLYKQVLYKVSVVHRCNSIVLKNDIFDCKYGEIINIKKYDSEDYSTTDKLTHKVITDDTIFIEYNYNSVIVNVSIYDINNKKYVNTNSYVFHKDDEKNIRVNIDDSMYKILYKDTPVNENYKIVTSTNMDLLYIVAIDNVIANFSYDFSIGKIILKNKKISDKFITIVEENNTKIAFANKVYIVKHPTKDNTSTKNALTSISIPFEEVMVENINDISVPCVLIDGDLNTKTKFISSFIPSNDVIYLPMNINYNNFKETVKSSHTSLITNNIAIATDTINSTPYCESMSYNKVTNTLNVSVTVDVNTPSYKNYSLKLYDIKDLIEVSSRDIKINTINNFDKAVYVFNDTLNTEPNISTLTGVNNVKYVNSSKNNIIDKTVHCYLVDKVGNKTLTMHYPIIYNITYSATENTNYRNIHHSNMTRYNNRFKGPRESYKFHNTYENCKINIDNMDEILNDISKKYNYKDIDLVD